MHIPFNHNGKEWGAMNSIYICHSIIIIIIIITMDFEKLNEVTAFPDLLRPDFVVLDTELCLSSSKEIDDFLPSPFYIDS